MTPCFNGQVNKEGKLSLDDKEKFKTYLFGLTGKRVQLTVEKIKHSRSNSQNRYYWGIVVKLIAQHTGHDPEQIHELLKQMFSPKWHMVWLTNPDMKPQNYDGNISMKVGPETDPERHDVTIPTSTARLDTLEFVEYTEKCRLWANEFLGLNVPLPGEVQI